MKEPKFKILPSEMLWFDDVSERLLILKTGIDIYENLKTTLTFIYNTPNPNEEEIKKFEENLDKARENCVIEMEDLFDETKTNGWELKNWIL